MKEDVHDEKEHQKKENDKNDSIGIDNCFLWQYSYSVWL